MFMSTFRAGTANWTKRGGISSKYRWQKINNKVMSISTGNGNLAGWRGKKELASKAGNYIALNGVTSILERLAGWRYKKQISYLLTAEMEEEEELVNRKLDLIMLVLQKHSI